MFGKAVALLQRALELDVLALQAALRDHAVDLDQQLFVVPGLGEIIAGAALQRVHGDLDRAVRGDHEDRRFLIARADFFEHLHAALVRHHQVQQHQIVGGLLPGASALRSALAASSTDSFRSMSSASRLSRISGSSSITRMRPRDGFAGQNVGRKIRERVGHYWISLSDCATCTAAARSCDERGASTIGWTSAACGGGHGGDRTARRPVRVAAPAAVFARLRPRGNESWKRVPAPSSLSTSISPPCSRTIP